MHNLNIKEAITEDDIHEVGHFRYRCFLQEGLISSNSSRILVDEYDFMPHAHVFTIFFHNQIAGTIRLHALSKEHSRSATMTAFSDILMPRVEAGLSLIDGARFAVDPSLGAFRLLVARHTLRLYSILAESQFFDFGVAAVQPERVDFFKRIYNFSAMSEPRPYSKLTKELVLLGVKLRHTRRPGPDCKGVETLEQILHGYR